MYTFARTEKNKVKSKHWNRVADKERMKRPYEEVAEANEETEEEGDQAHESGRGIFVHSGPAT
jgi:hypothetical protein